MGLRCLQESAIRGAAGFIVDAGWSERSVLDTLEWRGRFTHVVFLFAVPRGLHGRSFEALRHALDPLAP